MQSLMSVKKNGTVCAVPFAFLSLITNYTVSDMRTLRILQYQMP